MTQPIPSAFAASQVLVRPGVAQTQARLPVPAHVVLGDLPQPRITVEVAGTSHGPGLQTQPRLDRCREDLVVDHLTARS